LAIFRKRLPTWGEISVVFGVVVFFVHSWSVRGFLFQVPSFLLHYRLGQILAVFAYMMAFALLESLAITGLLVLASLVLPVKWFRQGFEYKGFLAVLVAAIASVLYQSYLKNDMLPKTFYYQWGALTLLVWVLLVFLFHYLPRLQKISLGLEERLSVMAYLYVPLGIIGIFTVIVRNVW
jgi:hypothetical protein